MEQAQATAAGPDPVPVFAVRRPGWGPPSLDAESLQLASFEPLEQADKRQNCPQCGRSRSLYCYDCLIPFTSIPSIQLPFQLHIIAADAPSKATGTHAAVLCPGQVQLHSLEALPQLDAGRTVLMYPSEDAVLPEQLALDQLDNVIIIDSKWRKAKELNVHPALAGMRRVKLPGNPRSCFWRFHTEEVSEEGVCTIEALHLLLKALEGHLPQPAGYWDNLLWYFAYQHKLVAKVAAKRIEKRKALGITTTYVPQQRKKKRGQMPPQKGSQQQGQQQQGQQQQQDVQPERQGQQHTEQQHSGLQQDQQQQEQQQDLQQQQQQHGEEEEARTQQHQHQQSDQPLAQQHQQAQQHTEQQGGA